jgi:predicted PurR-regulated permease PerM
MQPIPALVIRQIFLLLFITTLGMLIFWQLRIFVPAFLGSYTLYILLRRWMFALVYRFKWRKGLAALCLLVFTMVVILIPLNGLIRMLTKEILPNIQKMPQIWQSVEVFVHNLEQQYGIEILTQENLRSLANWGSSEAQQVLQATFSGMITVLIMFFILYFMLTEGREMEKRLFDALPVQQKNINYVKSHLNGLVFSNAIGIPLVALMQAVVALIGYMITGVPDPFLWFIATAIAAVVPVVGAMLVYIPLSILLISSGQTAQGIGLFLFGFLIIGSVDNLFRFWLQKRIGDTHPLITIFGVILGLNLFGFVGLIFGPILISMFLLVVQIYHREFGQKRAVETLSTDAMPPNS